MPACCCKEVPEPLAYVEWFGRFSPLLRPSELVYTSPDGTGQNRRTEVIPASRIRMACHLVPQHSDAVQRSVLPADDPLSIFPSFCFNPYSLYYCWSLVDHWAQMGVN
jgi:hypothetical protein